MSDELGSPGVGGPSDSVVPAAIRPEHKKKYALIYIRQSSQDQVKNNTGSTEAQRDLKNIPLAWGWSPEMIRVIDDDLGLSGTSSSQRAGLQRVEAMLDKDEVGLLVVRDASRLSRDPEIAERFLKKALRAGILLEQNGALLDLARSKPVELFGLRIQNTLAWWENALRRHNSLEGKEKKISQRRAVSHPPSGYVNAGNGAWLKDVDPQVREVIQQIKGLYLEFWSTYKTARHLRAHGVRWPKRAHDRIEWQVITTSHVHRVLTNPNYTADYHYRRRSLVHDDKTGRPRSKRRPVDDWWAIKDHHDPYISREEWERIQSMLHRGGPRRPAAGRGSGLLQGLLVCGRCEGRWMRTVHDGRAADGSWGRVPRYHCSRVDKFGTNVHRMSCSAVAVDHVVTRVFMEALAPVSAEAELGVIREDKVQQEAAELARRRELQRAEEHVHNLKRHLLSTNPALSNVKAELEQDVDNAIRDLKGLQRTFSDRPVVAPLTDAESAKFLTLTAKIPELWNAPTTTNEDRKHLLATVISKIVLYKSSTDALDLEIVWASGCTERRKVFRSPGVTKLISRMREEDRPVSEILDTITQLGITTPNGTPFTRKALQHKLWGKGFDTKTRRLTALRLIHALLLKGRSRQDILEILRSQGPQPKEGEWTSIRLSSAIKSLRDERWSGLVPRLPPDVPTPNCLPPEAVEIILGGRKAGCTFAAIAHELNAHGYRPPRAAAFSMMQTYQLYQHLKTQIASDSTADHADV